jgi:hypothetical protein
MKPIYALSFVVLAALATVACNKKAPEETEKTEEKSTKKDDDSKDKDKSKDDEAKKDDPAPVASADESADEPAEEVAAVPVAADFAAQAQTTIKAEDYKAKLDALEKEIGE